MALCVLAVLALPTTGVADNVGRLRSQEATLSARERSARIELFAVDSRLARARAALASIRSQIAGLDQERRSALLALGASRRTLSRSERLLGQQVRLLYVQDDVDPLAVFLGAASIEDAIDGYDSVRRAANAASSGVADANRARAGVLHILSSLAARRNRLERLQAAASAQGRILADAVQERRSYLARLQTERGLTQEQIAAAEARAQAAQAAAEVATVEAEAAGSIGALSAEPLTPVGHSAGPTSTGTGRRTLTVLATAYTLRGRTATGLLTGPGIVAVDPTVIPLGTRMTIPGYGQAVAADTGSAIKGLRIDLWVATDREARAWSWRRVTITLR